jgi:hypothetical protein
MSWQVVAGVAKPGQRRETRRLRLARSSDVFGDIDWVTSSLRGSWVQIPPPASQKDSLSHTQSCKMMYKSGVGAIIIALWTNNVVVLSY